MTARTENSYKQFLLKTEYTTADAKVLYFMLIVNMIAGLKLYLVYTRTFVKRQTFNVKKRSQTLQRIRDWRRLRNDDIASIN